MNTKKIKKIEGMPKFPELEDKINKFWKENKIFKKSVEQRPEDDIYRFIDGPPFVSGTPHYGSLLPSIAKDVIPRYWAMKGKRVRRVWGWDCHGLTIEDKVNKKFGIKTSKQLEEDFGIDRYIQACRNYVENTSSDWRWYIDKIGRWVDMEHAYYTMDVNFMESVIWAFKQIYSKGLIYKGKRVSLFSTDTSTPVSQFEVAMDNDNYRDIEDLSIFVKFELDGAEYKKLTNGSPIYLIAWTTTPWTIPANFALAVNSNFTYVLVEYNGEFLIVAEDRLEYTFKVNSDSIGSENGRTVRVVKKMSGMELEGLEYKAVYDYFSKTKKGNDFKVYISNDVTIDEGTGILHIAPAFGEVDFNLGKEHGLSDSSDIDEEGKITLEPWKGVYLRDASPMVAEDLQEKGNLLRSELYTHRLPFYRGENPLIYMAQEAYFINLQEVKKRMLELNKDIHWIPDHVKEKRFAHTVATSPDWCISRNRYWATVMPVWKSEHGDEIVIGSLKELVELSEQVIELSDNNSGKNQYFFINDIKAYNLTKNQRDVVPTDPFLEPMDLHRDICDKIVLRKDGKEYRRIPEVLDCWMDSGSVPYAEYHYPFENKTLFEKHASADYIIEYVGQVRAWFNVLLRLSTMLFDEKSFNNVICTGVLAGYDGRKMSKSFGNYPDPKEVLENIGGEAFRLYMMGAPIMLGGDMSWSDGVLNEQVKNILIPLWNTYKYLTIYADLHDWKPENSEWASENVLDVWLRSYMNQVTLNYSQALESYNLPESVKLIQPTIDNISSWWIRRSRDRFVSGDTNALQTLHAALVQFVKTFAPQLPFISEEMYQNLVVNIQLPDAKESVHLEDYPQISEYDIDTRLLTEMEIVRHVTSLGQNIRVTQGLKLRQPLSKCYVNLSGEVLIGNQVREDKEHVFKVEPESSRLVREELLAVIKDELNVKEVLSVDQIPQKENIIVKGETGLSVALDTSLTDELIEEGLLAELKRKIQDFRKTFGLQMGEKVGFKYFTSSIEVRDLIDKYADQIMKESSLLSIQYSNEVNGKQMKFEDKNIEIEITR